MSAAIRFNRSILLKQDIGTVWKALTSAEALNIWFSDEAEVEAREGGRLRLRGRAIPGNISAWISAFEDRRRLGFGWQLLGVETSVLLSLEEQADMTRLSVSHSAANSQDAHFFMSHEAPADRSIPRINLRELWSYILGALRIYLITGRSAGKADLNAAPTDEVRYSLQVPVAPAAAFDALVNPAKLQHWIAANARIEPREGGAINFAWDLDGPQRVLQYEEGSRLAYSWYDSTLDWRSKVEWQVEADGAGARISLVHSGFLQAPSDIFTDYRCGWPVFGQFLALTLLDELRHREFFLPEDRDNASGTNAETTAVPQDD